eukprot:scaffold1671_cov344-Pavlova_lutheri.AAC.43
MAKNASHAETYRAHVCSSCTQQGPGQPPSEHGVTESDAASGIREDDTLDIRPQETKFLVQPLITSVHVM